MKTPLLISLLSCLLLMACSNDKPEKVKSINETLLDTQTKTLEKAREVEQILNEEAKRRQEKLNE